MLNRHADQREGRGQVEIAIFDKNLGWYCGILDDCVPHLEYQVLLRRQPASDFAQSRSVPEGRFLSLSLALTRTIMTDFQISRYAVSAMTSLGGAKKTTTNQRVCSC